MGKWNVQSLMNHSYLVALVIAVSLLCVANLAHASIIRYDITGGYDTEGYNFTGFVDINSEYEMVQSVCPMRYNITEFLFQSQAGLAYGYAGYIGICRFSSGSTVLFEISYSENNVGKDNLSQWYNGMTGVWFNEVSNSHDGDFSYYETLPEEIFINSWWGCGMPSGPYWMPNDYCDYIRLSKASEPVPEPTTILLLGMGLVGLASFRRRLKK